ncbi:MAG: type IV secretory system conjugative DNA transfer family protein [Candidatus Magasanikbacteria bacterium]
MFFQFFVGFNQTNLLNSSGIGNLLFWIVIVLIIVFTVFAILLLVRTLIQNRGKANKAFGRSVLQILVPKERKSEGAGGQASTDDRLEQIKEEIGMTETLFSAVAALRAQKGFSRWFGGRNDHMSFEIVATGGLIYFYIDIPNKMRSFMEQQINAQHPHAQIDQIQDYNIFSEKSKIVGAYLTTQQKGVFPFKSYKIMESDPLASILNVLSKYQDNNSSMAIQFVIRSAVKTWRKQGVTMVRDIKKGEKFEQIAKRSAFGRAFQKGSKEFTETLQNPEKRKDGTPYQLSGMEEEMLKGFEEKLSRGGMDVTIRLLSVADQEEAARLHLDDLIGSFGQYNLYRYGNSFQAIVPKKQTGLIRHFIYRSFDEKRKILLTTDEMASFWHLPLHSTEAPNVKWLTGRKAPPPSNLPKEGLLLGYVDYRGSKTNVFMKEGDRRRHMYIIGKSGGGKSVFVSRMAIQDIHEGKGVCVIDPHGDLVEYILSHIPKERADDVVIFDPSDTERPIGLNMLEAKSEDQKDFAVQEMISIFYKLFPPEMIGPMFEHNMRNVMLTLMADLDNPGTIIDIPRMFTDDDYVKVYLKKLKDPVVRAFWEKEMAKTSDFHKSEMLGYLISKVGRFVENEMMRNIMGQQKSGFDFRDIMDNQKILLVNLAKGKTGEVNAKLLGLIIVSKLQMAALARADQEEEDRKDFYLYIDEFQNFVTDSISTILSEARKYKLDLIIAHQYMGQLTDDKGRSGIRDAVLGNAGTMFSARIGPDDSEVLAKEFAPTFGAYDLLNAPMFSWYTKLLIDNTASKPFLMQTFPPMQGNKELGNAIKQLSRLKYGRDQMIVESEIMERTKLGESEGQADTDSIEASL